MISINHPGRIADQGGKNVYILFGWDAVQARPNLDPYTSTLRTNDETMQVYTSDVHLKHHVRRGIKSFAMTGGHAAFAGYAQPQVADGIIFYEKTDESGQARDFSMRLDLVRKAYAITKNDEKDALRHCLDLPLFGYVHAVSKENFNVTNAANTLFRPVTFHGCNILPLGRNNAFPGEGKDSAGSASVDSLEYGFFLALWEVHLGMLKINARGHALVDWSKYGAAAWLELLMNGMWRAYTTDRYPSFTQRSQFAQFMVAWKPDADRIQYAAPQDLYQALPADAKTIKTHDVALQELQKLLPGFLGKWGCAKDTVFARQMAETCGMPCIKEL